VAVAVSSRVREAGPRRGAGADRFGVDRGGGRSGVADIQRARMIGAMAALARERGVAGVSVAQVVARSGVSRRTFYELFEDRDDCFAAAFEQGVARAAERVLAAYEPARGWRERMRAGLEALLGFLEEEPDLGGLCVVVALGASPVVLERRAEVVGLLVDAVDGGRREARVSARPTRLTAEGVVGAVLAVLHSRLAGGESVIGLQGALMGTIVLPYLGLAAAARETAAMRASPGPAARRRASMAPPRGDPLRDLNIRLTYRTVRVLLVIAELGGEESGPSNRRVADAAGVTDPGQISKLLARLEHLGLIENGSAGPARGAPNVWNLTAKGHEIERAIRQ
jgi:AcrR family transcriptional regulator